MLSEKRIISALLDAKKRGVTVRVILEPNPYGNSFINKKAFAQLEKNNIEVKWANKDRFVFTHAKFFLIDEAYLIMTANMTHSAFVANREFYISGSDPEIYRTLSDTFTADFNHTEIALSHPNLIISPLDAREKIEKLLRSATKQIHIFAEVFDDDSLEQILSEKLHQGISVHIVITNPKKISSNQRFIDKMRLI